MTVKVKVTVPGVPPDGRKLKPVAAQLVGTLEIATALQYRVPAEGMVVTV